MEKTLAQAEIEFQQWLQTIDIPEEKYYGTFNDRGLLIEISPIFAEGKISIDKELAVEIYEGRKTLNNFMINLETLEIVETKNISKLDDVLHRIIDKQWTDIEKSDIYITHDAGKKTMKFELTEEYSGTKKIDQRYLPVIHRQILWDGDTVLDFFVTDYNDPNVLYKIISFKISDMIEKSKIIRDVEVPGKFSVYTRRILKNYMIECI